MARDRSVPIQDSDIRLTVPARPENVAVIRHVLGALADALALPPALIDDVRLAVTEACTNVVRHAYESEGTIDVVVRPRGDALEVVVADEGRGIGPSPDTAGPGLGLPLIAALTDAFELKGSAGHGTEVRMTFAYLRDRDPAQVNPVEGEVGPDGRWEPGEPPA
jgi:serine/threonine-protein kinase RsbW